MDLYFAVSVIIIVIVHTIAIGETEKIRMTDKWLVLSLIKGMVWSLFITELLELAIALCSSNRNRKDFLLVFLVNVITNPVVVYLDYWFRFRMPSVVLWIVILEFSVWLSEALIYKKCLTGCQNPFLFSLVLNSTSYFGGMIFNWIL